MNKSLKLRLRQFLYVWLLSTVRILKMIVRVIITIIMMISIKFFKTEGSSNFVFSLAFIKFVHLAWYV